jgi:hypothetical protein
MNRIKADHACENFGLITKLYCNTKRINFSVNDAKYHMGEK